VQDTDYSVNQNTWDSELTSFSSSRSKSKNSIGPTK